MTASKAELWDQSAKAIKIQDEIFKFSGQSATNFLGLADSLQQAYEGDHIGRTDSKLTGFRTQLNSICGDATLLDALLIELAKVGYSSAATSASIALDDIAKGMAAASETVKNRAWTYGSISAAVGNTGTGTIYRLTTDKYGNTIETGAFPGGVVKAEVTSDKNTGKPSGTETATLGGSGVSKTDNIALGTCPSNEPVTLIAQQASTGLLSNGNFAVNTSGTGTVTATPWVFGNATETTYLGVDAANIFRAGGVTMKFLDNNSALQYISESGNMIDITKPCFLILRYYRYASCDGTLTLRLGTKTTSVNLTTVSDTTWLDLVIGVSNSDGWYDQFKEDYVVSGVGKGARVQVTLASRTTGSLGIGEIILAQPTLYDGKYYLMTAGRTDFVRGDSFTFTDSVSNTGRIQTTLARLYGKHLPHTSGTPTYADA